MMKPIVMLSIIVIVVIGANTFPRNRNHPKGLNKELLIKTYLELATSARYKIADSMTRERRARGLLEETYKWPNGIVSYHVWTRKGKGSFERNGKSYNLIKLAMKEIEKVSCVRFREVEFKEIEKLEKRNYLMIFEAGDSKCRTVSPGYGIGTAMFLRDSVGGRKDHCMDQTTIIHELLHVLGFIHEHQRNDRDKHIKLLVQNIKKDDLHLFDKNRDFRGIITLGAKYDRLSIMHYSSTASSKNGKKTMVWREDESLQLGGKKMSEIDKMQLNTYYKCKGYPMLTDEFKINEDNIEEKCPNTLCDDKTDGHHPHDTDKHQYVTCSNGKATCQPCFPENSVFVNKCGVCMTSEKEPCKSTPELASECPKDLCRGTLHGLTSHRHLKNVYVNCYFGINFGCYKCPNNHEFSSVEKACKWKPNLNLS